ncbi:OmpL47-type beta-barrel domain-containing protein [Lentzea terrae]|uniref:OmpL47-type beta-barrel domain-containing protein n=1 Tax=Lentzea terrae TaxID=2200761 RepID=UPI001300AB51|nr:PxKF domain-containing protein [Lentzea terrae]
MVLGAPAALATSFSDPAVTFSGDGVTSNGVFHARSGKQISLVVHTANTAKCVEVAGLPRQTSTSGATTWTFPLTTPNGADGLQSRTVITGEGFNPNPNANNCNTKTATTTASYVLDNTGPAVTASLSPAANAAGWNNGNVTVSWVANDGTGIGGGTTTAPTTISGDTGGQIVTGRATDALGNAGPESSVVVKRDTVQPSISGTRAPAANSHGWNNTDVTASFTCSDALSQIKSCTGATTVTGEGVNQSVTGTAVDNADNTQSTIVGGINIDKTAPTLTSSTKLADGTPYVPGTWTNQKVIASFDCVDTLSQVSNCMTATFLNGEGADQAATNWGTDFAGNKGIASVTDIDIDKTAPVTSATAPQTAWNNTDVTVAFSASDALSGVRETHFKVNGGAPQTGGSLTLNAQGTYAVEYWSTDNAGNTESAKTVTVNIDKTPPTITHAQTPAANANGWNNGAVTVTFTCGDSGGSGVASCGPNQTVSTEGANQAVTGTVTDNAGNTVSDPATVSVDTTKPVITASISGNAQDGWYNQDVTVSYECADALSGVDSCTAAQTLGEGANQTATGTATDAAGNSATATVTGVNVDKTAPALTGTPSTTGWSREDVTVTWACTDGGSGATGTPAPSVVTGEGANLSVSATCTDKAGNATTTTVSGIRIDRAAPNTTASVAQPFASGWYADGVEVTLSAADALAGVGGTQYRVDGGEAQQYTGPFGFTAAGQHVITFWSTDQAGNQESSDGNGLALWIDNAAPAITGSRTPANGHGWNNTDVIVSFACTDSQSGVASCGEPAVVTAEGAGQSVSGTAVDGVGKSTSTTVGDINIDRTAPVLTGSSTTGWHNSDVTVHWTAIDGLSGVDTSTQPADSVVTGEGRALSSGAVTVKDKAGNESAPTSATGVMIDRAGPVVSGGPITSPNAAGWYRDEVVVDFACADPKLADGTDGSGVATCPASVVLKTDGAGQSVTSAAATDIAGNTTSGKTVGGINIDGTAPSTSSDNQCSRTNGWCTGSTANVVLTATDALSGVQELHYRIDGGAEQVAAGASKTVAVPLDGSGAGTVTYWAVDKAGNAEPANSVSLKWDNIAPAVTHTTSPAPNADDWNNSDVTVHFTAKDDDAGSGLDAGSVTPDVVINADTNGQVVTGSAKDVAGNVGTDSVTIKLDKTKPTISAEIVGGAKPWFTAPVKVRFTCADNGSGIPATACPDDVVVSANGAGQSVTGTVTDRAGNSQSATVGGINVDTEAPVIESVSVADGAIYRFAAPAPACTAADAVSGVDSCVVVVTALADPGAYGFTATAKDKAGNTTTRSGRYQVQLYDFSGFLQPINAAGGPTSVFKAGSTVPVKFQLRDGAGRLVASPNLPQWIVPVRGGLLTSSVNETVATDAATTDGAFRWDAAAQQYIYNWQTKGLAAGYTYRIGARLDDGQVHYVTVGLK